MKFTSYVNKNKFFCIASLLFSLWMLFLIVVTVIGQRTITFYDALGQNDVSMDYSSTLPAVRYFFEPFAAFAFMLEFEFTWLFLYIIFYPIFRIVYWLIKRAGKFKSTKFGYAKWLISDLIEFSFKIYAISLAIIGIIILIGYLIQGFFFINRYFMIPVQIAVHACVLLICIKAGYMILKLFHSRLRFQLSSKFQKRRTDKKSILVREVVYLMSIGFILIGTNIMLISTKFMPHHIIPRIPLDGDEILIDFHVHTIYSDGWLTPEERVVWYIEQGINAAFFTDHDNIRGYQIAKEFVDQYDLDFKVLLGEEWTDHENDIHMNYFGIEEEIVPLESYTPGGPKAMNASNLIAYVKSQGGYISVNHYNVDPNPNGGIGIPYSLEQLRDWGVDGFEIINGGSYKNRYEVIRQFCIDYNLTCLGGSDIHTNEDLNTFIRLRLDDPGNFTVSNIFNSLKNNSYSVIAVEFYPKIVDFPGALNDFGFYVFEEFLNYILNMDVFQGLSWIGWSILLYALIALSYVKLKRIEIKRLKFKIE